MKEPRSTVVYASTRLLTLSYHVNGQVYAIWHPVLCPTRGHPAQTPVINMPRPYFDAKIARRGIYASGSTILGLWRSYVTLWSWPSRFHGRDYQRKIESTLDASKRTLLISESVLLWCWTLYDPFEYRIYSEKEFETGKTAFKRV